MHQKEDHREMLRVIQTAQRLLVLFLNVTDGCPRCLQKIQESLQ